VASLPEDPRDAAPLPEDLVEVYRCASREVADRVCTVILDGVEGYVHDRASHAFPTPSVSVGQVFVAVPEVQFGRARQLLGEAIEDGALGPDDGEIVE